MVGDHPLRAPWRSGFGLSVVVWASRLGAAGVRSRQAAKAPRGLGCRRRSPRRGAGRPSPMRTVWKSPTPALEVSALRLCGSARPVQVCRRSALRAGGGRGSVVCLAQRRRAAERSGVSLTCVATQGWAGRPAPMPTAWKSPTPALEVSALRLCGSARPVRVCRRSALRAGGGRRGVVCLAPSRQAAKGGQLCVFAAPRSCVTPRLTPAASPPGARRRAPPHLVRRGCPARGPAPRGGRP